jgi:hypothetical protein
MVQGSKCTSQTPSYTSKELGNHVNSPSRMKGRIRAEKKDKYEKGK